MIRIDDSLLEELGLIALPKVDRDQLLKQIYETLEMRVGMRLAERMTDQQLDEFERFIDTNDEAGALKWLETNFPDYKQVVADELDKLKVEIKQDSDKIVETLQSGQPQTTNQPPPSSPQIGYNQPTPAPPPAWNQPPSAGNPQPGAVPPPQPWNPQSTSSEGPSPTGPPTPRPPQDNQPAASPPFQPAQDDNTPLPPPPAPPNP